MASSVTQKILAIILFLFLGIFACKHNGNYDFPTPSKTNNTNNNSNPINSNLYDSICFDEQILPVLVSNCAKSGCHNDTDRQAGVVLISYESLMATISSQLLMQCIQDSGQMGMPRTVKLNSIQVSLIQNWINQGMKKGIDCEGPCDTSNVTFSGIIRPIIQNSCLGCHTNSTTLLTDYSHIKALVTNGKLLCSINYSGACQPMPQGGVKLPPCKLKQFKIWVDAGAPNN